MTIAEWLKKKYREKTASRHDMPYVLLVSLKGNACEKAVMSYIGQETQSYLLRSKTVRSESIDIIMDVVLDDKSTDFVNSLITLSGVTNASLLCYYDEYLAYNVASAYDTKALQ